MPGVVEVRRRPGTEAHALARGLAYLQGSGEAEPSLERSGEPRLAPEGSGKPETSWLGQTGLQLRSQSF
jgi:hypothetical protein